MVQRNSVTCPRMHRKSLSVQKAVWGFPRPFCHKETILLMWDQGKRGTCAAFFYIISFTHIVQEAALVVPELLYATMCSVRRQATTLN